MGANKRNILAVLVLGVAWTAYTSGVNAAPPANSSAQAKGQTVNPSRDTAKSSLASDTSSIEDKEVTLTGKIQDLDGFMTGTYHSSDRTKAASDAIKAGKSAVIQTSSGAVLLGEGTKGILEKLAPYAMQSAQLHGKLVEKSGLKYLEVTSVEKQTASAAKTGSPGLGKSAERSSKSTRGSSHSGY
jgi:hypothetical protein